MNYQSRHTNKQTDKQTKKDKQTDKQKKIKKIKADISLQRVTVTQWIALSVFVSGIREYLCNLSNGSNAHSIPCPVLLFLLMFVSEISC